MKPPSNDSNCHSLIFGTQVQESFPDSKKTEFKNDMATFLKVSLIYNIILVLGVQYFYRQHSIKTTR